MSQREAFEAILKEDLYDEVTRKVYADWLSENGFDEEAMEQYSWTKEKQEAIDWLKNLAGQEYYGYIVSAATVYLNSGLASKDAMMTEYLTLDKVPKFWECISLVLGKKVLIQLNDSCFYTEFDDDDYYNCGCNDYDDGYESCAC